MQQSSSTIFADDEHDQLARYHRRRGRHHSRLRFMQLEIQKEGLFIRQGREEWKKAHTFANSLP